MKDYRLQLKIFVRQDNICVPARRKATETVADAEGPGGINGGAPDGASKGNPHVFYGFSQAVHKAGDRACYGAVGECGKRSTDMYRLSAQGIHTVGHARRATL